MNNLSILIGIMIADNLILFALFFRIEKLLSRLRDQEDRLLLNRIIDRKLDSEDGR